MTRGRTPDIPPHLDPRRRGALGAALTAAKMRSRRENRVIFVVADTLALVAAERIRVAAYHVYPGGKIVYHVPAEYESKGARAQRAGMDERG